LCTTCAVSSNSSGWRPRPLESSSRVESVLSGVNCLRSHAESAKMGRLGPYNNTTAPIACSVRAQTFTFSVLFEVPLIPLRERHVAYGCVLLHAGIGHEGC